MGDMLATAWTLLFTGKIGGVGSDDSPDGPRSSEIPKNRRASAPGTHGVARKTLRPPEHALRDAALLDRLRRDDEEALAALIRLYDEPLRQFAYLTVREPETAADVVQDVFVSLWRRRTVLAVPGTVADYLYRAVRNRALDALKHEAAEARARTVVGRQFEIDPTHLTDTADAALVTEEFASALAKALESLTPRVRETFLMHRVQEMSYTEIASVLGVAVGTVQSQISRAARQILEYLAPFR